MALSVLIADSQRLTAQALVAALKGFPDLQVLPHVATSGPEALDAVTEFRPDVVVLDYWLPGMEGPATTRAILAHQAQCKVLLLSWFHGPEQVHQALASGAAGFLPKSITLEDLAEAIRLAYSDSSPVLVERVARLVKTLAERQEAVEEVSGRLAQLTRKELSVLNALKYGEPLDKVARDLFISLPTLKSHIRSILRKTGARSSSEAVAMALHCGLVQI